MGGQPSMGTRLWTVQGMSSALTRSRRSSEAVATGGAM